ncbi:MAG: hypothetical protein RJA80_783, partial [Actinomycetota bacterium]
VLTIFPQAIMEFILQLDIYVGSSSSLILSTVKVNDENQPTIPPTESNQFKLVLAIFLFIYLITPIWARANFKSFDCPPVISLETFSVCASSGLNQIKSKAF